MAGVNESNFVEIKIKTMDHQTYTIRTEKSIPVPRLKEQIAQVTGVVSDHQRLLFAGKVIKDHQNFSSYHVENGHTLHQVVTESPESDSFQASMQRFDRMIEQYCDDYDVQNVVPRTNLERTQRSHLLHGVEFYRDRRQVQLERVRLLKRAREIVLGLMVRLPAPEGQQLSRLWTALVDVQNHLSQARLETPSKTSTEAFLMSVMLDRIVSENGGPENYQAASAHDRESSSPSARNCLSISFHRCLSRFCHRRR